MKQVQKWFPEAVVRKAWIEFEDLNGKGFAEVDILVELPNLVVVIEAKLSSKRNAKVELETLYGPLVKKIFPTKRVVLVEAYNFCKEADSTHLAEILASDKDHGVLHFL